MLIYGDLELEKYKSENLEIQPVWKERNFVKCVKSYLEGNAEYILAVNGLPGTGKTVGILQAATGYDIAYMIAQKHDGKARQSGIYGLSDRRRYF